MDVVYTVFGLATDGLDKPHDDVVIERVELG
jgi:hypothetical protein